MLIYIYDWKITEDFIECFAQVWQEDTQVLEAEETSRNIEEINYITPECGKEGRKDFKVHFNNLQIPSATNYIIFPPIQGEHQFQYQILNNYKHVLKCVKCNKIIDEELHCFKLTKIENTEDSEKHLEEVICPVCGYTEKRYQLHNMITIYHHKGCNNDTLKELRCEDCGYSIIEEIPSLDAHEPKKELQFNDTEHWNICANCNKKINVAPHRLENNQILWFNNSEHAIEFVCKDCEYRKTQVNKHNLDQTEIMYHLDTNEIYYRCKECGEFIKPIEEAL